MMTKLNLICSAVFFGLLSSAALSACSNPAPDARISEATSALQDAERLAALSKSRADMDLAIFCGEMSFETPVICAARSGAALKFAGKTYAADEMGKIEFTLGRDLPKDLPFEIIENGDVTSTGVLHPYANCDNYVETCTDPNDAESCTGEPLRVC